MNAVDDAGVEVSDLEFGFAAGPDAEPAHHVAGLADNPGRSLLVVRAESELPLDRGSFPLRCVGMDGRDELGEVELVHLPMLCRRGCRGRPVVRLVAGHGERDVAAAAGQADQRSVVLLLLLVAFPLVVGPAGGDVQGCERGEEERAFELAVAGASRVFALDRGAGAGASPISGKMRAAVLTPMPGSEVRAPARECVSSISSPSAATCFRYWSTVFRLSTKRGSTVLAAAVPGAITARSSSGTGFPAPPGG